MSEAFASSSGSTITVGNGPMPRGRAPSIRTLSSSRAKSADQTITSAAALRGWMRWWFGWAQPETRRMPIPRTADERGVTAREIRGASIIMEPRQPRGRDCSAWGSARIALPGERDRRLLAARHGHALFLGLSVRGRDDLVLARRQVREEERTGAVGLDDG